MRIQVRATPAAKENKIEKLAEGVYKVWIKEPPVKGKANRAIVKLLAEHFSVPTSGVIIISGQWSKNKIVEIKPTQNSQPLL